MTLATHQLAHRRLEARPAERPTNFRTGANYGSLGAGAVYAAVAAQWRAPDEYESDGPKRQSRHKKH